MLDILIKVTTLIGAAMLMCAGFAAVAFGYQIQANDFYGVVLVWLSLISVQVLD